MNGIHDLGGMHGFGPIEREANEPVFHAPWEGRMLGISQSATMPDDFSIDRFRFIRESLDPVDYLERDYYDQWYMIAAVALFEAGWAGVEELRSGHAAPGSKRHQGAMTPERARWAVKNAGYFQRDIAVAPRFAVGAPVVTLNMHPTGHTRLPRYARGKRGIVHAQRGAHVFADSSAHGRGENPQHLYAVAIPARELWGPQAGANDAVYLDLWESYLEGAK
jgi:nitrile hydratase